MLTIEASIPKKWYKAGESVPITLLLIPDGYKKVHSHSNDYVDEDRLD
jgi:hypothetical protein